MLRRLSTIIDAFLLAMAATVALAALPPAHGEAAEVVSDAAKAAIALVFFLYAARVVAAVGLARYASMAPAPAGAGHHVRDLPGARAGHSGVGALGTAPMALVFFPAATVGLTM